MKRGETGGRRRERKKGRGNGRGGRERMEEYEEMIQE